MKKIFVIGGMGAGKSTVSKALVDQGLASIDLDEVGHEILHWDTVKEDLARTFGSEVFDDKGEVIRSALAARAFASPTETRKLNHITLPRIEQRYVELIDVLERSGVEAVVVECSAFKDRFSSMAFDADAIVAVTAPLEDRVRRAVASGFEEDDVRNRIARQIADGDRIEAADMVFENIGSTDDLARRVVAWWHTWNARC